MYEIKELLPKDVLTISKLAELLCKKTKAEVAFLDIVSVEKKTNKTYNVTWFGNDDETLKNYYKLIDTYFFKGRGGSGEIESKSLLFLKNKEKEKSINGISSRHLLFKNIKNEGCSCNVKFDRCLVADFSIENDKTRITNKEERKHIEKWESEILSKLCIASASFSKIEFKISDRDFVAAIWVGYNQDIDVDFNDDNSILKPYLENFLWSYSSNSIASELITETERQATRAAISQVMARNMSHNIGSHVLNRLTDGDNLKKLKVDKFKSYQSSISVEKKDQKIIQQLAIYNNYVKCRMDYLSDITFGTPLMHTHKRAYNELFRDFDKVRLLLEYISGLSEFMYDIRFTKENSNGEIKLLSVKDDLPIALPNDILGCQAFYNILENIIRNTAKHNQWKMGKTVFTINFREISIETTEPHLKEDISNYYEVEVYDNVRITGIKKFAKTESVQKNNYYQKNKTNMRKAVSNIEWLVYCQNEKINLSVLQDNNQLRNSSLGLLEMEASAAYLRKLDIIKIETDEYVVNHNEEIYNSSNKLNILKAFNKDSCLAYRFFISKPTEFLLVGDFEFNETQMETLVKEGIWVMKENKFSDELKKGIVYNHQFVLYHPSDKINQTLQEYKTSLPIRVLKIDVDSPIKSKLETNFSFSKVEEWIWQEWFKVIKCNFENINVFKVYSKESHLKPNSYNIALSHHDENIDDCKTDFANGCIQSWDVLSSNAKNKLPYSKENFVNYLGSLEDNLIARIKLFEAAMNSVIVIDERIQRYSKDKYLTLLNKDIFNYTNVFIPDNIDLAKENFTDELTRKIENFISTSVSLCQCKFLLIHYSILERMYGSSENRKEKIESKLIEWSKNIRVVITSGRGKPPDLPSQNVCYINLSPVLNAFTHARSKYAINYLLNTARK